jgi:hypothetical protein
MVSSSFFGRSLARTYTFAVCSSLTSEPSLLLKRLIQNIPSLASLIFKFATPIALS